MMLIRSVKPIGFKETFPSEILVDIELNADGVIQQVGTDLGVKPDQEVLDGGGRYISPGWIDFHTHVYEAVRAGTDPENVGPRTGVTRIVDAGSSGEASFPGFKKYVLDNADFPIECFLNIGSAGIAPYTRAGINLLGTYECAKKHADVIRGIKVLASKRFTGEGSVFPVAAAKRMAADLSLPVMVHIAEPPVYIEDIVDILDVGDVITHCFHGKVGNSVRTGPGRVIAAYGKALDKGIHLDVGHGAASFSYESATFAIEAGIYPTMVSTDLHSGNFDGPVGSLAATMSKMLACGIGVERVIRSVTQTPAAVLRRSGLGSLAPGATGDFTIYSLIDGDFEFRDAGAIDDQTSGSDVRYQKTFTGNQAFAPFCAVWGNKLRLTDALDLTGGS